MLPQLVTMKKCNLSAFPDVLSKTTSLFSFCPNETSASRPIRFGTIGKLVCALQQAQGIMTSRNCTKPSDRCRKCVCVPIHTCIMLACSMHAHTHTHRHKHSHVRLYAYIYKYLDIGIHTDAHTHLHTHNCTTTYAQTNIHLHLHMRALGQTQKHTYMCIYIHPSADPSVRPDIPVFVCVCRYACHIVR